MSSGLAATESTPSAPQVVVRPKRGRESLLDMVRSMGLMLVVIFLVLLVTPARELIWPSGSATQATVQDFEQLQEWRALTGHDALLPVMPSGFRINAATMSGTTPSSAHLHVGWVTPGSQYIGIDESRLPASKLLRTTLAGLSPAADGAVTIAGDRWDQYTDARDEDVLVRTAGGLTTVVAATVPPAEVDRLISALRPASGDG